MSRRRDTGAADARRLSLQKASVMLYRLTHIDDDPLPLLIAIDGVERVVTTGSIRLEHADEDPVLPGAQGVIAWSLDGLRAPEIEIRPLVTVRDQYRRRAPGVLESSACRRHGAARYTAEITDHALVLRVFAEDGSTRGPVRLFGGEHVLRFAAAPEEGPEPRTGMRSP